MPGCHLTWPLLAGIGKVESAHASGGKVEPNGNTRGKILGPVLDGGPGMAAIADTDQGVYDGNASWDRAVGPMQFIPGTWKMFGADGNGDGVKDPHNVFDAARAAGDYLCAGGANLADPQGLVQAVLRYNHSMDYVSTVLRWMQSYSKQTVTIPDTQGVITPPTDDTATSTRRTTRPGPARTTTPTPTTTPTVAPTTTAHRPRPPSTPVPTTPTEPGRPPRRPRHRRRRSRRRRRRPRHRRRRRRRRRPRRRRRRRPRRRPTPTPTPTERRPRRRRKRRLRRRRRPARRRRPPTATPTATPTPGSVRHPARRPAAPAAEPADASRQADAGRASRARTRVTGQITCGSRSRRRFTIVRRRCRFSRVLAGQVTLRRLDVTFWRMDR